MVKMKKSVNVSLFSGEIEKTEVRFVKNRENRCAKKGDRCYKLTLIGQIHQKILNKVGFFNKKFENKY